MTYHWCQLNIEKYKLENSKLESFHITGTPLLLVLSKYPCRVSKFPSEHLCIIAFELKYLLE